MDTLQSLINSIKSDMPKTYAMIKEAAQTNPQAYALVRRGLRGEVGCFFARERIRQAGQLERWVVAGNRAGFEDILPDQYHKNFDDFVEVVFFLPVHAPAQPGEVHHAD